jgi:hypothetical protein
MPTSVNKTNEDPIFKNKNKKNNDTLTTDEVSWAQ